MATFVVVSSVDYVTITCYRWSHIFPAVVGSADRFVQQHHQLFIGLDQSYRQLLSSSNDLISRMNRLEQIVLTSPTAAAMIPPIARYIAGAVPQSHQMSWSNQWNNPAVTTPQPATEKVAKRKIASNNNAVGHRSRHLANGGNNREPDYCTSSTIGSDCAPDGATRHYRQVPFVALTMDDNKSSSCCHHPPVVPRLNLNRRSTRKQKIVPSRQGVLSLNRK